MKQPKRRNGARKTRSLLGSSGHPPRDLR